VEETVKKILMTLLLAGLATCVACTEGCGPDPDPVDDDDTSIDDDDSTDDDDTTDDDDDLVEPMGLTFSLEMEVLPPEATGDDDDSSARDDDDSAADDDDSAADDDDSAADDDDSAADDDDDDDVVQPEESEVSAVFTFRYWEDMEAGVTLCDQLVAIEGLATFGYGALDDGSCNNCTGLILFDPDTAVDISNPAADPDHCDPAWLEATGWDFGMLLLQSPGTETSAGTAFGDYLELALIDAGSMAALGLDAAAGGGSDADALQEMLAEYGLVLSQLALTNNIDGSLGAASGLDAVANNAGGTSSWFFYFYLFRNPEENPHEGMDMVGTYGGQALWVITFSPE